MGGNELSPDGFVSVKGLNEGNYTCDKEQALI
ncbi:hypothetical protein BAAM0483_03905 [Bifidobacterium animalis subsp. animalis MCC 0483]|uniref:Uncharacterized protein n=1 Tax=Bifidobacterium animalis subsp. animalis MCC 0483 TaxID=1365955 RepID=A0AB34T9C7_9BIFI|nr:hypothetical protein BAAM0483_03905 [Bifidobacterium animalis subsp. animalis MCC 0483]